MCRKNINNIYIKKQIGKLFYNIANCFNSQKYKTGYKGCGETDIHSFLGLRGKPAMIAHNEIIK